MDLSLENCHDYQSYLDKFITKQDQYYIKDINMLRELVQLNYKGNNTKIYTVQEFKELKKKIFKQYYSLSRRSVYTFNQLKKMDPVLRELSMRDKLNQQKLISTIIYMHTKNKRGTEISGFIDFEDSLRRSHEKLPGAVNWLEVFEEKTILRPRKNDLSYLDWHTGQMCCNNTGNYIVIHDIEGLSFMYRGDRKKICIAQDNLKGNRNFSLSIIFSKKFGYVTLCDYVIRKK